MLSERRFCFQQCYLAWSEVLVRFLGELSVNLDCFKLYNEICTLSAFLEKFIIHLKNKFNNMKAPLSLPAASKESFWCDYSKYIWPLTSE